MWRMKFSTLILFIALNQFAKRNNIRHGIDLERLELLKNFSKLDVGEKYFEIN